jgi:hypothetical protein
MHPSRHVPSLSDSGLDISGNSRTTTEEPIFSAVMTNLPPAIELLVYAIAADAGRERAETLLTIVGAGPDSARKHLAAIDTELGAQSPGIPALSALIDQAEQAVSTSSPTVARQHVISEVVLRKFVKTVHPSGLVLAKVDLASGQMDLIRATDASYFPLKNSRGGA